jgi:hypothetical protein
VSEPKRYAISGLHPNIIESSVGFMIYYEDYARLKALTVEMDKTINASQAECRRLKAEVERLTKAGNGLHAFLINYIVDSRISSAYLNKLDDGWNAAKEGKQS